MVQQTNILDAPITARPRHMLEMAVTVEEMSNISSQLPLEVTMSHMLHYDPEQGVLHYGMEVADLVEAADRKVARKRVPPSVTLLQAHLELLERDIDIFEFIETPELGARWRYSQTLRRDDDHITQAIMDADIADVDDFFIKAAKQK